MDVCGGEVGGDHARDRLRLHFLYSLLPMTSQNSLETFTLLLFIFHIVLLLLEYQTFFLFVLQCHILAMF